MAATKTSKNKKKLTRKKAAKKPLPKELPTSDLVGAAVFLASKGK